MIGLMLLAQLSQPVPKVGPCPLGYYASGSYCVPAPRTDRQAVPQIGRRCPFGWYTQSAYCVRDSL